ncbi:MAG: hypothetical protein ACRC5A_15360 [Enterobacteriaceae bacterium]
MPQHSIWSLITHLSSALSDPSWKPEQLLSVPLILQNENEYYTIYESEGFPLTDEVSVEKTHLRRKGAPDYEMILFIINLAGKGITLQEIKQHYPKLSITDIPRGRSIYEVTSYSSEPDQHGRVISFNFEERSPEQLKSVVIA